MAYVDRRNRAPKTEMLPDERLRVTYVSDVLDFTAKTPAQLIAEVWENWGTPDSKFTSCRLVRQDVTGQLDGPIKNPEASPPQLVQVYEEISEFGETQVGNPSIEFDQYDNKIVTIDWLQFSAGTAIYQIPGSSAAPAPNSDAILKDETRTNDGTLQRIRRIYTTGGILADNEELRFGGKLKLRTIKSLNESPATPSGYTLVTESTEYVRGLPLYSYGFAAGGGGGGTGTGGQISQDTTYQQSSDQGATGVTIYTISYLTDMTVTTNPITPPAGTVLIDVKFEDETGFRLWTARYAKGIGEVGRDITYSQTVDAGATAGVTVTTITHLTASTVTVNPTTPPAGSTLVKLDHREADGYRVWTVRYGAGTGTVVTEVDTQNNGKLILYHRVALNAPPSTPSATIGGTVTVIDTSVRPADGYTIYDYRWAEGRGVISISTTPRDGGLRLETWVSLGATYDASFMLPLGILLAKDSDQIDGVVRWTVTCVQNGAGGDPTAVSGQVAAVIVTNGGAGFTSVPTVGFTGGGGTGAAATAVLAGGAVASLTLTNPGGSFTSTPTVAFSGGGGGSGAAAAALLTATSVASATVTAGGGNYTTPPTVALTGGGGSGATATAALTGTGVASVTVDDPGQYFTAPTVGFTGGGGSGASATAIMKGSVAGVILSNGGSGYATNATVSFTGGGGTGAAGVGRVSGGAVVAVSMSSAGSGYTSAPTAVFSGGGGTGAAGTAQIMDGLIAVNITNQGSGYATAPTVAITGGGGSGATAIAQVSGGLVQFVFITNPGTGYTSNPSVGFSGGGGTGAAATAERVQTNNPNEISSISMIASGTGYTSVPTVGFSGGGSGSVQGTGTAILLGTSVGAITITAGGSGYSSNPLVTITAGGGSGAAAVALLTGTTIAALTIETPGTGYTSAPTVTISGGGGSGATATAAVSTATVGSVIVTNPGSGYTSPPTVSFTGGGGSGAEATASLAQLVFQRYEPFVYPGRAKNFSVTAFVPAVGATAAIDTFLQAPERALVLATHAITYQASQNIGTLAIPLWNPTDSATVRATLIASGGFARVIVRGLEGYRAAPPGTASITDGGGGTSSILGEAIFAGSSGTLTLSGGPPDPGGSTWTLFADTELAFIGLDGTKYWRLTVITALVPPQAALPV